MDWQPGDMALCVKGGRIIDPSMHTPPLDGFPTAGACYTVEHVGIDPTMTGSPLALWLAEAPRNATGERVWSAIRFIKVTPPEADEFDREVIEIMTRKPVEAGR